MADDDISINDMLDNMEDNEVSNAKKVDCPIDGCRYSNRKVKSVSAHISASNQDDHIWSNTEFNGWKHFNRMMRKRVKSRVKNAKDSDNSNDQNQGNNKDVVMTKNELESEKVSCPKDKCGYNSKRSSSVAAHFNSKNDHKWSETEYDGSKHFKRANKTIHDN